MRNPILIVKILNLCNGALLLIYLFKLLHWPLLPFRFDLIHIILIAFVIYGLKSWIEIKYDLPNIIRANKITNTLFSIGAAVFIIGIMFKIMHWPFSPVMLILGVATITLTYIISADKEENNPEIIDDFNHE